MSGAGRRPGCAGSAVGLRLGDDAPGAVVLVLGPQAAGIGLGDQVAAVVVVEVGRQRRGRHRAGALVDVVLLGLVDAPLVVVAVDLIGTQQRRAGLGVRQGHAVAVVVRDRGDLTEVVEVEVHDRPMVVVSSLACTPDLVATSDRDRRRRTA